MKVACIQPRIQESREKCYKQIDKIISQFLKENPKPEIICLPERWVPFNSEIAKNFQSERGEDYLFIKNLAQAYSINILSGAIWEKRDSSTKPFITCYFFNSNGEEIGRQDKIHLYTYERKYFQASKKLHLFKLSDYYFSILICFDVAFFETPRLAVNNGADLLFSPTQIREEGIYNWNIYLQARVLENRIPIVACNTLGEILNRKFPGKSKIISFKKGPLTPSKLKILEALTEETAFINDNIDLDFPKKLRENRLKEKINPENITVIKR